MLRETESPLPDQTVAYLRTPFRRLSYYCPAGAGSVSHLEEVTNHITFSSGTSYPPATLVTVLTHILVAVAPVVTDSGSL